MYYYKIINKNYTDEEIDDLISFDNIRDIEFVPNPKVNKNLIDFFEKALKAYLKLLKYKENSIRYSNDEFINKFRVFYDQNNDNQYYDEYNLLRYFNNDRFDFINELEMINIFQLNIK